MIVRGFERNTSWKDIKGRTEEILKVSQMDYERVLVIGQRASFAIIIFQRWEAKQKFKDWLGQHGEEVKNKRGL